MRRGPQAPLPPLPRAAERYDAQNEQGFRDILAGVLEQVATLLARVLPGVNDRPNTKQSYGITIDQRDAPGEALSLKLGDVAHGATDVTETDTYGTLGAVSATLGGLNVRGIGGASAVFGLHLVGVCGAPDTTKTTSSRGVVTTLSTDISGTGAADLAANANAFAVTARRGGVQTAVFIVDAEGDTYRDGTDNTFDAWHDAELLRAFHREMNPAAVKPSPHDRGLYGREDLRRARILAEPRPAEPGPAEAGTAGGFYNESALVRLAAGAAWQIHEHACRVEAALRALAEANPEMAGVVDALAALDGG